MERAYMNPLATLEQAEADLREDLAQDQAPPPGGVRSWIFTFGSGHLLRIGSAHDGSVAGSGVSLDGRYIRIRARTDAGARGMFISLFGNHFASQYPLNDPHTLMMIAKHQLTELVITP